MSLSTTRPRVMLVDDHAVVREGYRRLLEDEPDLQVVAEHGDADAAYAALGRQPQGTADVPVRLLSMHDSPAMVMQALNAGAAGFVTKSSAPALLVDALRRVGRGETGVLSPDLAQVAGAAAAEPPHRALSAREFDVLRGLVEGLTLAQIATRLHLSSKTVSNYQTQIRQRLGLATAIELLHDAREHRLFVP